MEKILPDEKITMMALEQANPFARNGVDEIAATTNKPYKQRDFSHLDDPVEKKQVRSKKVVKAKKVLEKVELQKKPKSEPQMSVESTKLITESHDAGGMPSYRTEFSGRDVMVGLIANNTTNPITTFAFVAMALDFGRDKIRFDMEFGNNSPSQKRNQLIEKFLQTDAKYLLMIDDDVIPCIGRVGWMQSWIKSSRNATTTALQRHILHRLINSGKTIISGAYFNAEDNASLICNDQNLTQAAKEFQDIIAPVQWVGMGCILFHRNVFEDLQKHHSELKQNNQLAPWNYFNGNDAAFCERANKLGHISHIDLGTPVYRLGYKVY